MINNFINDFLKIKNYKKIIHNSWKDNITYEIQTESWDIFIVQQMLSKKTNKNRDFIDKVISFINTKNNIYLIFANKYLKNRFIDYKWCMFQVMKKINWNTIKEENINKQLIWDTAKYIATFHNTINDFDFKEYEEINYYKKMHTYRNNLIELLNISYNEEINNIFHKMNKIALPLKENKNLPKWVIHWDPSFKNFLINDKNNIVWLIDYDMLSVNNTIWDLADLIRSYMKIELFNKKEFELLINSYNNIRTLTIEENKELKNYCMMMILDTWFRYLLSALYSNNEKNLIWDNEDSIKKAGRCLKEIEKLETFY